MFVTPAYAQAAGGGPGGFDLFSLLPLVLIFVVFWFLLIRPQQKKMKQHREMISAVRRGDRVLTGIMVKFETWKIWMVLAIILACVIVSLPNLFSSERLQSMPSWFPKNQVNLGLDLQGGSHLLLEVDLAALEAEHLETLLDSIRGALRRAQIGYTNLASKGGVVSVEIRDPAQVENARSLIEQAANGLDITINGPVITAKYNQAAL